MLHDREYVLDRPDLANSYLCPEASTSARSRPRARIRAAKEIRCLLECEVRGFVRVA
jgi:hypothetical protein